MTDEEAHRMTLYGPCEQCYGPRDIRTIETESGKHVELICPSCERDTSGRE